MVNASYSTSYPLGMPFASEAFIARAPDSSSTLSCVDGNKKS